MKQVSVFAENRRGTMQAITQILYDERINILGSVTNDSGEYGIVRLIVSDPQKAHHALNEAGYQTRLTDVIGVEVEDREGNMNQLLKALSDSYINVDYIYLSFNRKTCRPILIFKTEEYQEVINCLETKGFTVVEDDFYQ